MEHKFGSLIQRIIVGSIITVSYITPALAQQALTRAEVYQLSNQVQLLLQDKPPRIAKKADVLVPLDALQTKAESAADLVFNERSLAKIGSSSTFRFKPGLRRFELPGGGYKAETIFELKNGIALILTPSGSTGTTIETPQSHIEIIASAALPKQLKQSDILPPTLTSGAVIVAHESDRKLTRVFNLTNQEIKVATLDSTQFKFLKSGQTVSVNNGVISKVEDFNLSKFYQTTKIAVGLGPGQEGVVAKEEERVRKILQEVRKETLAAVETQKIRLEGLCTLNGRGGASTLSTNCITTNEDNPIGDNSRVRESVTPPRNNPPVDNPPVNNPPVNNPPVNNPTVNNPTVNNPPVNNPPVNNPTVNNPPTGGRGANIQGGGNNPIP